LFVDLFRTLSCSPAVRASPHHQGRPRVLLYNM